MDWSVVVIQAPLITQVGIRVHVDVSTLTISLVVGVHLQVDTLMTTLITSGSVLVCNVSQGCCLAMWRMTDMLLYACQCGEHLATVATLMLCEWVRMGTMRHGKQRTRGITGEGCEAPTQKRIP